MSNSNSLSNALPSIIQSDWEPDKIWRVVRDIEDSPKISLLSLLTALLARLLLADEDVEPSEASFSAKVEQSKALVELMRCDAAAFCDDESNVRATDVKRLLRNYHTQGKDNYRRASLCNALNIILSEYRNKRFGDLPPPCQNDEKEDLIFIPNDMVGLESDHIAQHMLRSKRQPDVLATYTSTLRENFKGHEVAKSDDWVQATSDDKCAGPSNSTGKLRWPDVHQSWDVTMTGVVDEAALEHNSPEIEKILQASKSQDRSASSQRRISRKRRSKEEPPSKNKKARVENDPEPKTFLQQVSDEQSNLTPELRCTYYALERLSSACYITHSTAVELEDTRLSLRWYDAQGCFLSEAVDIVEQMPIFIVMLIIFQRFNKRMWGLDTERVGSGNDTFEPDRRKRCPFELIGRRTFASPAVHVADPSASHGKNRVPLFYKSSWVKCIDSKEPDTINTAHERANTLLPENFRKMVTDHIPTVIASRVCNKSATSTIRMLVREVDDSAQFKEENIRKHARVQVLLVTPQLEPIQILEPPEFWRVYWEILRCHYLLWKIGIAHRDISITNLMCTTRNGALCGVLNDYDFAAVMKPGNRCPETDDYERAGTTPFMAADLLRYREAKMKRWYRHDLESFTWCLSWEMLESPPRLWSEGRTEDIFNAKRASIFIPCDLIPELKKEWFSAFRFSMSWFHHWSALHRDLDHAVSGSCFVKRKPKPDAEKIALRDAEDEKKDDKYYVQFAVEAAQMVNYSTEVDAIQDLSWISVELLAKDM